MKITNNTLLNCKKDMSNNNYYMIDMILTYYTIFLIILNYIVPINVTYALFSILTLKQVFLSYYKYRKENKTINLVEYIASMIAFIGLAILLID